jgi:hypothetical protein
VNDIFEEAAQTLLLLGALFNRLLSWGQAPKPPGSASPRFGQRMIFCEAEQTLLLLFWKRRALLDELFSGSD